MPLVVYPFASLAWEEEIHLILFSHIMVINLMNCICGFLAKSLNNQHGARVPILLTRAFHMQSFPTLHLQDDLYFGFPQYCVVN